MTNDNLGIETKCKKVKSIPKKQCHSFTTSSQKIIYTIEEGRLLIALDFSFLFYQEKGK